MKWDKMYDYKWLIKGLHVWMIRQAPEGGEIIVTKFGILTCLKLRFAMRFWGYSIISDEIDIENKTDSGKREKSL